MNRKALRRLIAMVLCMMVFMSVCVVPAANAAVINKSSATFSGTIMNNNWVFRSKSTVKITNTGSQGSLEVTVSCSGCTVNKSTYTIPMGRSYTFEFTTPARNYSTFDIKVVNTWGKPIEYNLTRSNVNTLIRTK